MSTAQSETSIPSERRAKWVEVGWYAGIVILIVGSVLAALVATYGLLPLGTGVFVLYGDVIGACYCAYRLGKLSE